MSYPSDVKRVGIACLRAWKNVPHHFWRAMGELRGILGSAISLLAAMCAISVNLAAPFLFWLAPVLAPWFRLLQDREDARVAEAHRRMLKALRGPKAKAWEGDQ